MDTYQYVIVGGGLAGGNAADGIREMDEDGSVALITQEPRRPYHRPPLSKSYLIGEEAEEEIYLAKPEYYEEHNIDLMTNTRVTAVDPEAHTVTLADGQKLKYEKLLLATGGTAKRLPLEGADLSGVITLRRVEDSDAIREATEPGKHVLILGGSFIGSEVAAGASMLGADVTMVFPEERLLERIAPREMSEYLYEVYGTHNVRILPGTVPERFMGGTRIERAELSNGAMPNVDVAVMGVGIALNTELAAEAGLGLRDEDDAVIVNEHLQTSDPDIYAAGDIAAWPGAHYDKRLRVEHWDVARAQGLQAGRNMAGAGETYDVLPYFFSDLFDLSFEVWGDLSAWDQTVTRGILEDRAVAFYYFHEGQLVGVLAMGRPEDEREPMQTLVKMGPEYDQVSEALADGGASLADLVESL